MRITRDVLIAALGKPTAPKDGPSVDDFDPWVDLMRGIHGSYASDADRLAITALEALRDSATFDYIEAEGFAGEFMLYVLSGFGFTDYGSSPRGAWPDHSIADLWGQFIVKWTEYADAQWGADGWRA